ncbi:hypothetical protein MM236_13370 [Belliella sp. DSM 107340]|uniref:Uncharacterized protein n=1 Tax=Belliella calami TaxID=2923436 RepID=A0ABS9UR94_9BACT|nr:hypothetical protein [Belliella calami]MCH7398989.1 hypothetical protein [Belliella calami]
MRRSYLIFIFSIFCIQWSVAQSEHWKKPLEIKIDRLSQVSFDNQGFIFVTNQEGNIYQYDGNGELLNNFSPSRQGKIDQIEAAWTVNIFTFSVDLQEYRILDRFLNPISENIIQQKDISLARAATLGNNNIIWIYDESDFSLNQYDHRRNQILQKQPLNLILTSSILQIQEIKEYQNLVFLKIKDEGITILDNQANFIKTMSIVDEQRLSFWKDNLLTVQQQTLSITNYQNGKSSEYKIPEYLDSHQVLISTQTVVFYDKESLYIFSKANTPLSNL